MGKKKALKEQEPKIDEEDIKKKIIWGLSCIAFVDMTKIAGVEQQEDSYLIKYADTKKLSEELRFAIKSIKMTKEGVRLEMEDKMKAIELLGKHFGVFVQEEKQEPLVTITQEERAILKKYEQRMMEKRNGTQAQ